METIKIFDPVAAPSLGPEAITGPPEALGSLSGKVIGMISNEWRCVKIMLTYLAQELTNEHKVARTPKYPVEASMPAPKTILDEAAQKSDAVIVAMAN